ncbi:MAG: hypothetical protein ACRCUT_00515, partial [Spirochaetota bacterium]
MRKFLSVLSVLFILCIFSSPVSAIPLPDGVTNAISQIQDTAAAVKNFSAMIYDIVSFFTRLFGFGAILLLIAVILTSAGLVSLGVPAGRWAFFFSLLFWDALWGIWIASSGPFSIARVLSAVAINLKVIAPFALFNFLRWSVRLALTAVKNAVSSRRGNSFPDIAASMKRISLAYGDVQDALLSQISSGGNSGPLS